MKRILIYLLIAVLIISSIPAAFADEVIVGEQAVSGTVEVFSNEIDESLYREITSYEEYSSMQSEFDYYVFTGEGFDYGWYFKVSGKVAYVYGGEFGIESDIEGSYYEVRGSIPKEYLGCTVTVYCSPESYTVDHPMNSLLRLNEIKLIDNQMEKEDYCGDNVTWVLDDKGVITISGTGDMYDYCPEENNNAPWAEFSDDILAVKIESGVTSVGENAFLNCYSLYKVDIADTVTCIGDRAFYPGDEITITIPKSVIRMGCYSWDWYDELSSVCYKGSREEWKKIVVYDKNSGKEYTTDTFFNGYKSYMTFEGRDTSGTEGKLAWNFENGVLTISGSTEMWEYIEGNVPGWEQLASETEAIIIEPGVKSIGMYAFAGFEKLSRIEIPDSVTYIGNGAFAGCENLKNIIIPESVKIFGSRAMEGTSLENIYYGGSKEDWGNISIYVFRFDSMEGVDQYYSLSQWWGTITSAEIYYNYNAVVESGTCGDNVTWALDSAGTLTISGTGQMYDYNSFEYYPSYKLSPFAQNTHIKQITINKGVTSIGGFAFLNCSNLTNITLSNSLTNIGEDSFYGCSSLKNMVIPDGVTSIGNGAFDGCSSLTSVIIPDKITSIENSTFYNCTNLTNVTIPDKVTNIGDFAFRFCSNLTNITIPNGVTNIGSFAFANCSFISVTIPDSVTSIGGHAFAGCDSLKSINIPNGITSIEEYTFSGCDNLTGILIPDGVTNIGDDAFSNCSSLTSITIPNGVKSIGIGAFRWCENLTDITIPVSVTSIGDYAFVGCDELKDIFYYTGTESEWNSISVGTYNNSLKNATVHYAYIPVSGVSINKTVASVVVGKEITLTTTVMPDNATNKAIIWTTSDENVAIVEDGTITGISAGDAIITATSEDGGYTDTCKVTVRPPKVSGVELNKKIISMKMGENETLIANVIPEDADNKNVIWKSNNENIVKVNGGILHAVGIGTTTVTVTTEDGGYNDACEITVLPVSVTGLEMDKMELSILEGQTGTFTATVLPENATNKDITWTSSDEKIATVENGTVTGVSAGTAVIIVRTNDGNFSKYCLVVVVSNIPTSGVLLNTSTMSLVEGDSDTLTATVKPDNATNKNIIWSSNNETVATVDNGKVTAVAPGTAVIIATTEDGGHIATCIVTVSSVNQEVVSAPIASVLSGIVKENTSVILLSATKNAEIYYTLDGTAPSKQSTKYTSPVTITAEMKIKAIAVKAGMQDSNISTFNYTLADPELPYVNVVTNVTGNKGDITTVSVNTTENSGMAGGSFNLIYDNTVVELVSVNGGNIISSANPIINDTYRENKIRVVWGGIREINSGGELLNAQFRILDTDKAATYFNLEKVKMADGDSNKITLQSSDGVLTISEAPTATAYEYYTESTVNADNKSINVNVSVNSEQNGILIVAVYDKYGELIQMKYTDVDNIDNTYTLNFDKVISTEANIKVFVWSSFNTMQSLSGVEEI